MSLEEKVKKAIEKAEAINKREYSLDLSQYIAELKDETLPLAVEADKVDSEKLNLKQEALSNAVEKSIQRLNNVLVNYFKNKLYDKEFWEDDEELDIDTIFGEQVQGLDPDARKRISAALKYAIHRQKSKKKSTKGTKVKRLPPLDKPDMADVAHELGMDDLAKELTVEHAKPIFSDVERDEQTGVVRRRRIFNENPDIDTQAAMDKIRELSQKADIEKHVSIFEKARYVEYLIGKLTVTKLRIERDMFLLQHCLDEINNSLTKSDINTLMEELAINGSLEEVFEKAFKDRKY